MTLAAAAATAEEQQHWWVDSLYDQELRCKHTCDFAIQYIHGILGC